jgi:hypothetical protein
MKVAIGTCLLTVLAIISFAICPPVMVNTNSANNLPQFFHSAPMKRVPGPSPFINGATAVSSYNWGGYAVTGTSFTDAKASWIVPTVNCAKSPNAWVSFWVGIDGFSSNTVEQTGTLTGCSHSTAVYHTWYEFYPAATTYISTVPSKPGDKMSAEVHYNGSKFTLTITDETTGKSFTITQAVSGAQRTSAEFIAEAPSSVTGILNLGDFTKVSFGNDYTMISGTNTAKDSTTSGTISAFGTNVQKITQADWTSFIESTTSALSTDGSSFQTTWKEYN